MYIFLIHCAAMPPVCTPARGVHTGFSQFFGVRASATDLNGSDSHLILCYALYPWAMGTWLVDLSCYLLHCNIDFYPEDLPCFSPLCYWLLPWESGYVIYNNGGLPSIGSLLVAPFHPLLEAKTKICIRFGWTLLILISIASRLMVHMRMGAKMTDVKTRIG